MMNEQQIPKLVASLVEHQSAFDSLPTDDAQWVIQNTKSAIAIFNEAIKNRPKPVELLLDPVGIVNIMETTEKFVATEKFVRDTGKKAKVKISYLGDNFTEWFLGEDGKVEALIGEQTLRYARLKKASVDAPIITKIGGEENAESALTVMYSLMEKQRNGEAGVLLTNGYANIFYIRDKNGVLRAVSVSWDDVGWRVNAYSVTDTYRWLDGRQVFFRIPVAA